VNNPILGPVSEQKVFKLNCYADRGGARWIGFSFRPKKKKKNKLKGKTKGIQEYAHLTGVQTHR